MCAVAISYSLRQLHKTVPSTALSFHCCRSATLNAHMHINSLAVLITRVYTHESTGVCVKKYRSFGTSSDSVAGCKIIPLMTLGLWWLSGGVRCLPSGRSHARISL